MAGTISNPAGSVTTGYSVPASLFIADAGTEGAPSYTFSGDLNTGMFSPGADQLGFTTGGTTRLTLSTTAFTSTLPITATTFTVTGSTIPTNGVYLPAANTVGIATNGVLAFSVSTALALSALPLRVGLNTITADPNADNFVVQGSGEVGISILAPDANDARLYFGSTSSNRGASLTWHYNDGDFDIITNKVGGEIMLAAGAGVPNVTLSGASGSELLAATGSTSVAKFLRIASAGTLTIATGVVTATGSYHLIDTEGAGASDDLDTINGGTQGNILVISAADSARTVVAKDATGNLLLAGDFTMDNAEDTLTLQYRGTNWCELSRSDNGA